MPNDEMSKLIDPRLCIREAARLVIPVDEGNWELVKEDAGKLNILQAAITHLVYLDADQTEFQQKVMEIVFTAYLMGREAGEAPEKPDLDAFRELIAGLDLSGLRKPDGSRGGGD